MLSKTISVDQRPEFAWQVAAVVASTSFLSTDEQFLRRSLHGCAMKAGLSARGNRTSKHHSNAPDLDLQRNALADQLLAGNDQRANGVCRE